MLNERDAYELAVRKVRAGHQTLGDYCWALERACMEIAQNYGASAAGRIAAKALLGHRRPVDQASRAVAQAGHRELDERLDERLDDELGEEGFRAPVCECGHALGDHRVVSQGLGPVLGGVCLVRGCPCTRFELAGA
jgi:hypothetical protein